MHVPESLNEFIKKTQLLTPDLMKTCRCIPPCNCRSQFLSYPAPRFPVAGTAEITESRGVTIKTPIFGLLGRLDYIYTTPSHWAIALHCQPPTYRPIRTDTPEQADARREYHETLAALLSSGF